MVRFLLLACLLGLASPAFAQLNDSFEDGNFTTNPAWTPNAPTDWTIDNGQLRSNAATNNYNFYISTPQTLATEAQWEMKINLQFNTSSTNYVDVYLTSNEANLQSATNGGYFVRIGGTLDEVSLYRLSSGANTLLINGTDNRTNASNNTLKIKVVRNANNLWSLSTDISGTGNAYQSEGTATDNAFTTSNFFGFRVQQSTNSFINRHFFDDISISTYVPDTTPPTVAGVEVLNANQLLLTFSENVKATTAENTANYTANNGLGSPAAALMVTNTQNKVTLTFAQAFASQVQNALTSQNIEDLEGNKMTAQNNNFTYIETFAPQYQDLVITEIMADPRGSAQPLAPLPDAEYIELYNRSDKIINLKGCTIADESSSKIITSSNILLYPKRYALLCDATQAVNFQSFGDVVPITGFVSLTNAGERLSLRNAQGALIFSVRYSDTWYGSTAKADGGWSLEMRDVQNPCLEKGNWIASNHTKGGTPAAANSLQESLQDKNAPALVHTEAINDQTIRLTFSEKMDSTSLRQAVFALEGFTLQILDIESPTYTRLTLQVLPALQPATVYRLQARQAKDCSLNALADTEMPFALPAEDAANDIILNEILFNPRTGGVDFVELYNNSNKYINLKDWKFANIQDNIVANQKPITTDALIFPPKSYLLFTTNADIVLQQYPLSQARFFQEVGELPAYSDDEGTVILLNPANAIRERFDYKDDFHFALLDNKDGVSLERTSPALPTNDRNSWHSASERVGFATPAYKNSQDQNGEMSGEITVNPAIFTPDGDANDDFTNVYYKFPKGGNVITATVYDRQGRKIKVLAENQLLGTEEGAIMWDGTTQTQGLAPQGYYVIIVRVFNTQGEEKIYKKPVAVGIRF